MCKMMDMAGLIKTAERGVNSAAYGCIKTAERGMKLTAIFLLLLLSVVLVAGCSRPTARKDTDGATATDGLTAADSAAQVTDHGARGDGSMSGLYNLRALNLHRAQDRL